VAFFLILEGSAFPPFNPLARRKTCPFQPSRSSGAADPSRTPCAQLDHNYAQAMDDRPGEISLSMPMLPNRFKAPKLHAALVTQ
jgi:hypothetical protein